MFKKQSETRGELTGFTNEMLGGLKVVQAFGHQEEACREFDEINRQLARYSLKATIFSPPSPTPPPGSCIPPSTPA